MKRKWAVCIISAICLLSISGPLHSMSFFERFSLKLSGGCGTMAVGDLNTYLDNRQGFFDEYISLGLENGLIAQRTGNVPHLDRGPDMFVEIMVYITRRFALSIGYGRMNRKADSVVQMYFEYPSMPGYSDLTTWKPDAEIVVRPLLFTVYYFLPVMKKLDIYFHAGVGVYNGIQSWEAPMFFEATGWSGSELVTGRFSGRGHGFHGGVGAEFKILSWLAVFLEGRARSASIKELKGEWDLFYGQKYHLKRTGTIWFVVSDSLDFEGFIEKSYLVREDKPDDFWITSAREWKVDLSGLSGFIGIKISFGSRSREK